MNNELQFMMKFDEHNTLFLVFNIQNMRLEADLKLNDQWRGRKTLATW